MKISHLACAALLCWATTVGAASEPPRPFVAGSMKDIAAAHASQPFILAFWSITCVHCKANLDLFGRLLARHPDLPLVMVSTDSPDDAAAIGATLQRHGLEKHPSWVFADTFVERLYFEVDRRWRGELPRTYLYRAGQPARAISGKLDETELERWIQSLPDHRDRSGSN